MWINLKRPVDSLSHQLQIPCSVIVIQLATGSSSLKDCFFNVGQKSGLSFLMSLLFILFVCCCFLFTMTYNCMYLHPTVKYLHATIWAMKRDVSKRGKKRGGRGCWLRKVMVTTKTKFWYLKFECEWISRLTSIHKSKSTQFISSNLLLITQIFHS